MFCKEQGNAEIQEIYYLIKIEIHSYEFHVHFVCDVLAVYCCSYVMFF